MWSTFFPIFFCARFFAIELPHRPARGWGWVEVRFRIYPGGAFYPKSLVVILQPHAVHTRIHFFPFCILYVSLRGLHRRLIFFVFFEALKARVALLGRRLIAKYFRRFFPSDVFKGRH